MMYMELNDDMICWIETHRNDDPTRLRLKYHGLEHSEIMIMQIECRKRASKKLPKILQNNRFLFPTILSSEQCTSEALAEQHAEFIRGKSVLDMTCGLGIDTFHIAQNVQNVTAIEIAPEVALAAQYNSKILGLNNVKVICDDCTNFLQNTTELYDTIFIDPARRGSNGQRLFALSECMPNVIDLLPIIRNRCKRLVIKVSPMLDITQIVRELNIVSEIYAIGTRQECKEIVAIIDFDHDIKPLSPMIHALTIGHDNDKNDIVFTTAEEQETEAFYKQPEMGMILYEPYPSIMKASPLKLISQRYKIGKLHPNTHLYLSFDIVNDFPGNKYFIEQIIPFNSRTIKNVKCDYPTINVAVRNFCMSTEDLKKKLKIKDGGTKKLFGVTTTKNERILIIASPC